VAEETYDPQRIEQLKAMLRELAERIIRLDAEGRVLEEVPALLERLGTARAELFRYEVRSTFDSPEVAEHRRIVGDASEGWVSGRNDLNENDEEDGWPPASR
jgi:PAS domain-containing protein